MPIRLSGINSGLDTDAIVQELVKAYGLKTEKYEKAKTKLEWKQEAWQSLNTKIYGLYTNVSNLRYTSAYNMRRTSVSDATKATVTASDTAVTGTQKLNILKNAQAAYITGGKLGSSVTGKSKLSELGFTGETTITVSQKNGETKDITVNGDTTITDFVGSLKEAGLNASFDENNKRMFISAKESGVDNDFELLAGDANGGKVLGLLGLDTALTEKVNGVTQFTGAGQKYAQAYAFYNTDYDTTYADIKSMIDVYLEKQANNVLLKEENESYQSTIDAAKEENKEYQKTVDQNNKTVEAKNAYDELSAALADKGVTIADLQARDELKAEDLAIELGLTTAVDPDVELSEEEAAARAEAIAEAEKMIADLKKVTAYEKANGTEDAPVDWSAIDVAALEAETAETQAKIDANKDIITAEEAKITANNEKIAENDTAMASQPAEIRNIATLGTEEERIAAMEALANRAVEAAAILADPASATAGGATKINGSDAEIRLNGVLYTSSSNTFSINGLTIDALGVTGDGEANEITITTTIDTQGIYDKIKDFLTEYNSVINEMTKLFNADSAKDYEPLTDEEKDAMSDTEIEKWEAKIKSALLRRDSSLDGIMSAMINSMSQSVEVNGEKLSLSTFGIQTLGFLNAKENEQYAYHIDGDADDANSSGKPDKLMAAIQDDPDKVADFMKQLTTNLYQAIDKKMKSTSLSSAYKVYNDKELDKQMEEYEDLIKKWEDKVAEQEDFYYHKFSQMEVQLSKLQSQTNSLAGMLGNM